MDEELSVDKPDYISAKKFNNTERLLIVDRLASQIDEQLSLGTIDLGDLVKSMEMIGLKTDELRNFGKRLEQVFDNLDTISLIAKFGYSEHDDNLREFLDKQRVDDEN